MKTCSVDGCNKRSAGRGLCGAHYQETRRNERDGEARPRRRAARSGMSSDENTAAFWDLADRSGGEGACWLVTKIKPMWNGYCTTRFGSDKKRTCHRISWELTHGPIDESSGRMVVLHDCPGGENRACINPAHLRLGTYSDNTKDMYRKGRDVWRSPKTWRRLSAEEAEGIRLAYAAGGVTQATVAARFGVSPQVVSAIVTGIAHNPRAPMSDEQKQRNREATQRWSRFKRLAKAFASLAAAVELVAKYDADFAESIAPLPVASAA